MNILELCRFSELFKEYTINMVKSRLMIERFNYIIQASAILETCLDLKLINEYEFDHIYAVLNRLYYLNP